MVGIALIKAALGNGAAHSINGDINALRPFTRKLDESTITLERQSWEGGTVPGGYDWALTLTRGKSNHVSHAG